jgi:hypothetical protein
MTDVDVEQGEAYEAWCRTHKGEFDMPHISEAFAAGYSAASHRLAALSSPSYDERVRYEERILAAEMRAVRLKGLVRQPEDRGAYVGDTYYPVGGTEASHRWDGNAWQWLPEFEMEEDEA